MAKKRTSALNCRGSFKPLADPRPDKHSMAINSIRDTTGDAALFRGPRTAPSKQTDRTYAATSTNTRARPTKTANDHSIASICRIFGSAEAYA